MLKIRLSRTGKKDQPSFRVILQEKTSAVKGGKVIENLGNYKPAETPKVFKIDLERVKYWISKGAQPSDTLAVLLKKEGLEKMESFIELRNKKRKSKKEDKTAQAPAPSAS